MNSAEAPKAATEFTTKAISETQSVDFRRFQIAQRARFEIIEMARVQLSAHLDDAAVRRGIENVQTVCSSHVLQKILMKHDLLADGDPRDSSYLLNATLNLAKQRLELQQNLRQVTSEREAAEIAKLVRIAGIGEEQFVAIAIDLAQSEATRDSLLARASLMQRSEELFRKIQGTEESAVFDHIQ